MALLAAVFHGTWNILVKVSGDPITTFRRATVMAAIVATLAFAPAWLLFTLMAIELPLTVWVASALGRYRPPATAHSPTWRQSGVIGFFFWAGYFLVLWALSLAPLAVVAPVRELAIVAVAVWGVWRLREGGRTALKLSGAAATLAGVALLAV